jgi:hypothetical protein
MQNIFYHSVYLSVFFLYICTIVVHFDMFNYAGNK